MSSKIRGDMYAGTCTGCHKKVPPRPPCPECGCKLITVLAQFSTQIVVLSAMEHPLNLAPLHDLTLSEDQKDSRDILSSLSAVTNMSESAYKKRYQKIDRSQGQLLRFVQNDPTVLERIVQPLRAAKSSYVLGNELGCIALCGVVTEMMAVIVFESALDELRGKKLNRKTETVITDVKAFDEEKAVDRFRCLRFHGLITEQTFNALNHVREKRNNFLHAYSQSYADIDKVS